MSLQCERVKNSSLVKSKRTKHSLSSLRMPITSIKISSKAWKRRKSAWLETVMSLTSRLSSFRTKRLNSSMSSDRRTSRSTNSKRLWKVSSLETRRVDPLDLAPPLTFQVLKAPLPTLISNSVRLAETMTSTWWFQKNKNRSTLECVMKTMTSEIA